MKRLVSLCGIAVCILLFVALSNDRSIAASAVPATDAVALPAALPSPQSTPSTIYCAPTICAAGIAPPMSTEVSNS